MVLETLLQGHNGRSKAAFTEFVSAPYMPDSHKFVHYHWIRVFINQARAEIAHVGIRYRVFQKQEENHLHQQ